jgi:hypothetical protein
MPAERANTRLTALARRNPLGKQSILSRGDPHGLEKIDRRIASKAKQLNQTFLIHRNERPCHSSATRNPLSRFQFIEDPIINIREREP